MNGRGNILFITTLFFISFLLYLAFFKNKNKVTEEFNQIESKEDIKNYNDFLDFYNIKDKNELQEILNGNYNEDLTYIYQNNMTLYYSVFSKDSIQYIGAQKKFYNISPYFKTHTMNDCPSRNQYEYTHIALDQLSNVTSNSEKNVFLDKSRGLDIKDTTLYGPLSHQLGILPNEHSVFLLFSARLLQNSDQNSTIMQIFANNMNNNSFKLDIIGKEIQFDMKELYTVKFIMNYGENTKTSDYVEIKKDSLYLLTYIKNVNTIDLLLYDMSNKNFVEIFKVNLINPQEKKISSLSNKEIVLNTESDLDISIFSLAIFNQAINDKMYIINHFITEIAKTQSDFRNMASAFFYSQTIKEEVLACPYDKITCQACSNITDFSDTQNIINIATDDCKKQINNYCKLNTKSKGCECWAEENKSSSCKIFRSIFDSDELCKLATEQKCFVPEEIIELPRKVDTKKELCDNYKKCVNKYINPDDWTIDEDNILAYKNIIVK